MRSRGKSPDAKTKTCAFRLSQELYEAVEAAARAEQRSVSNYIVKVLTEAVEGGGSVRER